ncbi:uncharacterized protein [Miscanthus floridulus]|uniref:uncharacterized protein n=1 Tax=Miscanthus floridulus TaxID=154761 RepID=UPI0034581D0D
MEQAEEEEATPHEAKAHESDEAEPPSVVEATEAEAEALRISEAEATEAEASRTTKVEVAESGALRTAEAKVVEAGVGMAEPVAQEAEIEAAQASIPPSEVADAETASIVEQPTLTSGEGSSALVRVQPEPHRWDHPRVLWQSRDHPEGEPLFTLEDTAKGGCWDSFEQYRHLAERSLQTALSIMADDLPGVAQELEARSLGKSLFLRRERGV